MAFHKLILLCFLLLPFGCLTASSQQDTASITNLELPPAIQNELSGKSLDQKIDFLLKKTEAFEHRNLKLAKQYAHNALELSKQSSQELNEAKSQYWLTTLKFNESVYSNNLELLLAKASIAAAIFEQEKKETWRMHTLELMASIAHSQSSSNQQNKAAKKKRAKEYIDEAIQLFHLPNDTKKDSLLFAKLIAAKGTIYYKGDSAQAIKYWRKAHSIFKQENDSIGLARIYLNLGIFAKDGLNDHYFKQSINLYQLLNNQSALKRVYLRYGSFCIMKYQFTKEVELWDKGLNYLHQGLNLLGEENICDALNRIGFAYYLRQEEIDLAIDSAEYYFMQAINRSGLEMNSFCLEYKFDEKKAICAESFSCDTFFEVFSRSSSKILYARERVVEESVREIEEYNKKIKAIEEARKRKIILYGFLFGLLSLGILFYFIYQRQRIKTLQSKSEAQEAQIQSLGARMTPHFISNTLNAIDSMIYTDDKEKASKYLVEFARLTRMVLENSESTLIPLQNEIKMLRYYISLEEMRFENKLTIDFDVAESLDLKNILIPPMLIQPFIENSIIHGIQPKESNGMVNIKITDKNEHQIECIIEDNGIGRIKAKEIQQQSSATRKSYAMEISNNRLQLINRIKGAHLVVDDLDDAVTNSTGTRVRIIVPKTLKKNG